MGPIPEDTSFDPQADGWVMLHEPPPTRLMLLAVPLGMVLAAGLALLWSTIVTVRPPADSFSMTITLPGLLAAIAALLAFLLLHELLHALPQVLSGSSEPVVIGFWPRYMAPYVAYLGPLSREAQLVSGVMPLLVLTLLPFAVALVAPAMVPWMAGLSILNVLGSAADLVGLVLIVRQVPPRAILRNQGHVTWWRTAF